MNRTAYYLGMKSCEEGKKFAAVIADKIKNHTLDSAYFISFGDSDYSKEQKTYDSLMFETYRLRVISPGWQPILVCYMDTLDSLMTQNFDEDYRSKLWDQANKGNE